jgi:hypothetical protein
MYPSRTATADTAPFRRRSRFGPVRPRRWTRPLLLLVFFLLGVIPTGESGAEEYRRYLKQTGERTVPIQWRLEKNGNYRLTYSTPEERSVCTIAPDGDTRRWHYVHPGRQIDLTALRKGDTIAVKGRVKEKSVDKTIGITGAPWYQATSFSLRPFVLSDRTEMIFWTLLADRVSTVKMRVRKEGRMPVSVNGARYPTRKIDIAPTGFKSMFWKGSYWFRVTDGVFVQYEGPSGLPGSPTTRIVLQRAADGNHP